MARVGFVKTFSAGAFTREAVLDLFATLKSYVVSAGFTVLINDAAGIDFLPAGYAAGTVSDDVPHFALSLQDYGVGSSAEIETWAVHGQDYVVATNKSSYRTVDSSSQPSAGIETVVRFAADGAAGWWWLHVFDADDWGTITVIGASVRRYPTDLYQGEITRYGLVKNASEWCPAYSRSKNNGSLSSSYIGKVWSPVSHGLRRSGSPLQKMAVPVFPVPSVAASAVVYGEVNELMVLTDGYAHLESVAPGWLAIVVNGMSKQHHAVPAPAAFDVL